MSDVHASIWPTGCMHLQVAPCSPSQHGTRAETKLLTSACTGIFRTSHFHSLRERYLQCYHFLCGAVNALPYRQVASIARMTKQVTSPPQLMRLPFGAELHVTCNRLKA